MTIYTRTHEEHWLRDKQEEGRVMVLDDDSRLGNSSLGSAGCCAMAKDFDDYRKANAKRRLPLPTDEHYRGGGRTGQLSGQEYARKNHPFRSGLEPSLRA